MCSVWTPVAGSRNCVGPRPERHHDLLQRGVAGSLAEAVDGHLDLARTGLDRREGVCRRETQVVVAVDADRRLFAHQIDDALGQRPEFARDGVADGIGDVDGGSAGLDDRLVDLEQEVRVGARGVLGAEFDLGVAAELLATVADPADRLGQRRIAIHPELVLEVDVARRDEHMEMRAMGDLDGLDRPLWVAIAATRERRDGDVLRVSWAIRRTASKSPGEAAGKPASMTSTLSRASWRATSSFSAAVSPAPGACSPSRRVVSKMRTLPGGTCGPAGRGIGALMTCSRP